jgi:hypothetical protein
MKRKVFDILMNEYHELSNLRERSIKNIEETTRTYVTFIGFVITATALLKESYFNSNNQVVMMLIILLAILVGVNTYHSIISSNINQTIYTRELNLTRKFLSNYRELKNKILLPINGDEPNFDNLGIIEEKFSINGSLALIKIINCLMAGVLIFFLIYLISCMHNYFFYLPIEIDAVFITFIISFCLHNNHHKEMIAKGESKWKEIKEKRGIF